MSRNSRHTNESQSYLVPRSPHVHPGFVKETTSDCCCPSSVINLSKARHSKEFLCLKALFFRNIYGILSNVPWCLANIMKLSLTYASIGNVTFEWDFAAHDSTQACHDINWKRTLKLWVCPVLDVTVLNSYSRVVAVARMFGSLFKILIACSYVWQCVRNSVYTLERLIAR